MRKVIKTVLLTLGLIFTSMTMTPIAISPATIYYVSQEIPETLSILQHFDIDLEHRLLIKHYPAMFPINPTDISYISSLYGKRIHPIYEKEYFHRGIDIAAVKGTPVLATGEGTVLSIKHEGGYGNQIIIGHEDSYTTRYAHLNEILVKKGDRISRGDTIGKVGSTGLSTGNHLHYEISHHHKHIDPMSIYPDTLQETAYLSYLQKVNDYYTSCSDFCLTF